MGLTFTVLGCGSSGGVPRIGGVWGACDPSNPKNRRRRSGALVERQGRGGTTRVLIDTSADIREQLLEAKVDRLDAVLYTHDHADHTHGIDDLRVLALAMKRRIDVHADAATARALAQRFDYCFAQAPGSSYPAILRARTIVPGVAFRVEGPGGAIEILPFAQTHADGISLGFRISGLAYSPDVSGIPTETMPLLAGLDVWIVDALRYQPHPSHFTVAQALEWIGRVRPGRAILTHLHTDLDYARLAKELPAGVEPAYDGMVIALSEVGPPTPTASRAVEPTGRS